ncbi:MAG: hypothetical protein CMJ64_16450 [Planctomycetaceae bacterium]|jgi:hypothetical protein|nr:hypothetical protein [Planctomycetaceae bacterium]
MKGRNRFSAILVVTAVVFFVAMSWVLLPAQITHEPRKSPQQSDPAQLRRAIKDLASSKFQERQAASELLAAAGNSAVELLEKSAKTSDRGAATRTVEILTAIAGNSESRDAATAALERLAKSANDRVAKLAVKAVKEFNTTDEERAIAAFSAEGVRMFPSSRGGIYSVTIATDNQLALLRHLNKLPTSGFAARM